MGIFSAILGLPLAPVRGVLWIGEIVRDQVEQEMSSPAAMRRDLEAVEEALRSGQLSEEDAAREEDAIIRRVVGGGGTGSTGGEE
ncbi:gas vesicle protein GvpG [Rhodococcus sp. SGAir0479]|uniref:gas vesicle protein GvpG n=1 Tax=Rhodococcus sp. SGAir0479 TaxID=2567884 RepID=UPI0010CD16F9|nr:gas vesicle protein GvpG [Rhodococcus sp. SGAir0479]QCQ91346.1 gas vesicle protein G [Rhodococcus sp. SGAir0479]